MDIYKQITRKTSGVEAAEEAIRIMSDILPQATVESQEAGTMSAMEQSLEAIQDVLHALYSQSINQALAIPQEETSDWASDGVVQSLNLWYVKQFVFLFLVFIYECG